MSASPFRGGPWRENLAARDLASPSSSSSRLQRSPEAMNGETLQRKVTIINPQGFHMRPQTAFYQRALQFQSTVTLCKDDRRVNGKSLWDLMLLGAEPGAELVLEVSGSDAKAALEALAEILAAPSADDTPEPPVPPKG